MFGPKKCGWTYPNGFCGHHFIQDPYCWGNFWATPANMIPHYAYFPAEHGYYYFHPHNVTRWRFSSSSPRSTAATRATPLRWKCSTKSTRTSTPTTAGDSAVGAIDDESIPPTPPREDDLNLNP